MLAQPVSPETSSISPSAPTSVVNPLTIGARRARNAMRTTAKMNPSVTSARIAISSQGMRKPPALVSISIKAPATKAMRPPMPREPYAGRKNLGNHEPDADDDQCEARDIHREQMERVRRNQQAYRACHTWKDEARIAEIRRTAHKSRSASGSTRCSDW
jgi:hypothetical protein